MNFMIFGDSYSTHKNHIPEGYAYYYDADGEHPDAPFRKMSARETWWGRFAERTGATLVRNDSWSGSTVGYTGYTGDCSQTSSFICRHRRLCAEGFYDKNQIDTVFVFGTTNDSWANAPLGEVMLAGWQESDLFSVLPAVCHFAYSLKQTLPDARVIFIANTGLKPEIFSCMKTAAEHFGAEFIALHDIEKLQGHPTSHGMAQICDQLIEAL